MPHGSILVELSTHPQPTKVLYVGQAFIPLSYSYLISRAIMCLCERARVLWEGAPPPLSFTSLSSQGILLSFKMVLAGEGKG